MQLDLLSWRPAPVQIIPFPTKNRIGLIRKTASNIYNSRTDREADAFWKRSRDSLHRQMGKAGVDQERIEFELKAFQIGVETEMGRLALRSQRPGGDVA